MTGSEDAPAAHPGAASPSSSASFDQLLSRLEQGDPDAVLPLGDSRDSRAIPHLTAFRRMHPKAIEPVQALARLNDPDTVRHVLEMIRDPRPEQKMEAIDILRYAGTGWAVRLLTMQVEDRKIGEAAALALAHLVPDPPTPPTDAPLGTEDMAAWRSWATAKLDERSSPLVSWASTVSASVPGEEDERADAVFTFTAAAKQLIEVVGVFAACSCTTTTLEPLRYASGEQGRIRATFDFGSATGQTTKRITVFTLPADGSSLSRDILEIKADISRLIECTPQTLVWKVGDQPLPKRMIITEVAGRSGHLVSASVQDGFTCALTQDESSPRTDRGRDWTLTVTPSDMSAPMSRGILLEYRFASGRLRQQAAWALVVSP